MSNQCSFNEEEEIFFGDFPTPSRYMTAYDYRQLYETKSVRPHATQ